MNFLVSLMVSLSSPEIGKVIGNNDWVQVNASASNIPVEYQKLVDAFGRTNFGCTVTHIGNGYALSAGHCFDATEAIETNQSCSFVSVDWGYRYGKETILNTKCEIIVAMQNTKDSDFALLKMKNYPDISIKPDLDNEVYSGSLMTIFSHPDGQPLNWSQYCLIESQVHPPIPAEFLQYACDTSGGSSGAVLLNPDTLKVMGIHKGGEINMNYGTRILGTPLEAILIQLGF